MKKTNRIICASLLMLSFPALALSQETDSKKPGAYESAPTGYTAEGSPPEEEAGVGADVFERQKRHFHPFVSVTGVYSDNIYKTDTDEENDFMTIVSPGFWVSFPSTVQDPVDLDASTDSGFPVQTISTSSVTPGGLSRDRDNKVTFNRYRAFFLYGMDIERFSDLTEEDDERHRAEAILQYNFRGGLSFHVYDQYKDAYDSRGATRTGSGALIKDRNEFSSNLVTTGVDYVISPKFRVKASYSNYFLDYDTAINKIRDRSDNSITGAIYYKISPKTALFTEYRFYDIGYDNTASFSDSQEHHIFQGLQWEATGKTTGDIKVGYGLKDFDSETLLGEDDAFLIELKGKYQATAKSALHFTAGRRYNETSINSTNFTISHLIGLRYKWDYSEKIQFDLNLNYAQDDYDGQITIAGQTDERKDDWYRIAPAMQYTFRQWLMLDCAYIFDSRDSNFTNFDYDENAVYLRLLFHI